MRLFPRAVADELDSRLATFANLPNDPAHLDATMQVVKTRLPAVYEVFEGILPRLKAALSERTEMVFVRGAVDAPDIVNPICLSSQVEERLQLLLGRADYNALVQVWLSVTLRVPCRVSLCERDECPALLFQWGAPFWPPSLKPLLGIP